MSKRFQNFDELKLAAPSLYLQSLFNEYCPLYIQELFKKNKLDYNLRSSDFIIPGLISLHVESTVFDISALFYGLN